MAGLPPLSLYVHFPWCVAKCPYCDFNSHSLRGELPAGAYIDALLTDLSLVAADVAGREIISVFFGGGTPSLFPAVELQRLLAAVNEQFALAADAEITLEANPGTVERDSFTAYAQAGINRVSLGVQSFDEELLQRIGRIHGRAEIERSLASLKSSGINNFNIDLMFALPGQSLNQARQDVQLAMGAGPTHVS